MWKPLTSTQRVNSGDKIRYLYPVVKNPDSCFKVVKTDEHYFELLPEDKPELSQSLFSKKIVRYFDIGYNVQIEIWDECL